MDAPGVRHSRFDPIGRARMSETVLSDREIRGKPCSQCGKPVLDGLYIVMFGSVVCGRCNGRDKRHKSEQDFKKMLSYGFWICVVAMFYGMAIQNLNYSVGGGALAALLFVLAMQPDGQ
jgi:hypothetical protein